VRRHRLVGVFWERSATIKTESANRAYTGENWREKRNNIIKISDGREVGYQRNHVGIYDEWGFHFIYQYRRIAKFQHPKAIFFSSCAYRTAVRTQSTKSMDWTDYFYAVCPNGWTGLDLGSPSSLDCSPDRTVSNTALMPVFGLRSNRG